MSGHSKWATTKHKKAAIDAKRGKLFAEIFDVALPRRPVPVKVLHGQNFALLPLGELAEDGGAGLARKALAVEPDLVLPDGERRQPLAVREVKVNFSLLQVRFAVNRFTNRRIWYIIIFAEYFCDKCIRLYGLLCIKYL